MGVYPSFLSVAKDSYKNPLISSPRFWSSSASGLWNTINLRTIESCLREGETQQNVEYGMITLKCDVVFHIESRLVALVNAGKNVDAGTDHGVREKLCGISSMGQQLSIIDHHPAASLDKLQEANRGRGEGWGNHSKSSSHSNSWLYSVVRADPDLCVIFGKPVFLSFSFFQPRVLQLSG